MLLTWLYWRNRRLWCPRFHDDHVRDWDAFDEMGIARCGFCRSPMSEPDQRPRLRL